MSELKGKVAIVTGASKGIGAGIAKGLGAAGAAVVVNYASSKEGADRVVAEIESMLSLASHEGEPPPQIVKTVATDDRGVDEVWAAVEAFRTRSAGNGLLADRRRAQLRRQLEETLQDRLLTRAREAAFTPEELENQVDRLEARTVDPLAAAEEVMKRMGL